MTPAPREPEPKSKTDRFIALVSSPTARMALIAILALIGLLAVLRTHDWVVTLLVIASIGAVVALDFAIGRQPEKPATADETRLLSVISHDMRQPLHAITLYLSALNKRVEAPEAREILGKMDRAADSLAAMFASLVEFSRLQGDVEVIEEDFALQDAIQRSASDFGDAVHIAPTALRVHSDESLLERMLRQLIANAIKHGGGAARIEVVENGGLAEIRIADQGTGIPAEDQTRVFEPFVRLDKRAEGLGLGLAIARRIADALHVPLGLVSVPGDGTLLIVRLPLAPTT